jgi:hypothetical protein
MPGDGPMLDDPRARQSVGIPAVPFDADDEQIRSEATDAFLRVQAGEIPLPGAGPETSAPTTAEEEKTALVPVTLVGRLRGAFRRWTAFGKPAFAVDPLWAEAFRAILPLGLFPADIAGEIERGLGGADSDSVARALLKRTIGATFPEITITPVPIARGAFSRTYAARRPNGGALALTLRLPEAPAQVAERHAAWRDAVGSWVRQRGLPEAEILDWLDFAVEYIAANLDCQRRVEALDAFRSEPFGKAALRACPEMTSAVACAVTLPVESLTAATSVQTVNGMWRRFAVHAFDQGLFHADLDTAHWRTVGDQRLYDGVEFIGRIDADTRTVWSKLFSRMLARDAFGTNDVAAERFPGLDLSLAESHLRGHLDTALPATQRLTRILARILVDARRAGARVTHGDFALLHGLSTLEAWSAAVAPTHDPLPMFFVELQEIQAKRIAATALVDGANVKQAAKDYLGLLRGSFKAGFGWLTGSRIAPTPPPAEAPPPKPEPPVPLPAPILAVPPAIAPPRTRPGIALPFFQIGLVLLTILLFLNPNRALTWHTAVGGIPLDALLAFALCGTSFFLSRRS